MVGVNNKIELISNKILGNWQNQIGSTLQILAVNPNGLLSGHYQSPLGTTGRRFKMNGVIDYNTSFNEHNFHIIMSFHVRWNIHRSLTNWTGYIEQKEDRLILYTRWNLTTLPKDKNRNSIVSGKDIFNKDPIP